MADKFLKKIIAQNQEDLRVISALCSEATIKQSDIKFLKKNKIFLISLQRFHKEKEDGKEKINSICKFEFIDKVKSKRINQNDNDLLLELLAINILKKDQSFEIALLFKNNGFITLSAEVIEVTLEDQNKL